MSINDYIISLNWKFIGICGCMGAKTSKYANMTYPNYEIRIAFSGNGVFQIRHNSVTRKAGTGLELFKIRYKEIFP